MKYVAVYHCKACDCELTFKEVMESRGVCPYCGVVSDLPVIAYNKRSKQVDEDINEPKHRVSHPIQ